MRGASATRGLALPADISPTLWAEWGLLELGACWGIVTERMGQRGVLRKWNMAPQVDFVVFAAKTPSLRLHIHPDEPKIR